jgi:hypothetical protein
VPDGIDVANYQAANYRTAGLSFVFVKATEGTSYVNPKHTAQVAHGRAAGLVVGHYHFVRPGSMTAQAAYFLAHARPRAGDILCLDWEDARVSGAQKDEFLRAVRKARPDLRLVLYANRDFWLHRDRTSFCADGLFIADPSAPKGHPRVEHPWLFHQHSISGGTDQDTANFTDRAALAAWARMEDDMPTAEQIADAVWAHLIPNPARPDAHGKPMLTPASSFQRSEDSHFDALRREFAAQTAALTAAVAALAKGGGLTAEQITAAAQAGAQAALAELGDALADAGPEQP